MAAVFMVAEHFNINPSTILNDWDYPLFLDAIERVTIKNELDHRIQEKTKEK